MRFKFCGGLDVPDWLLSGISVLSELTSVKLKLLGVAIMKDLSGELPLDYQKALKRTSKLETLDDQKSAISSLMYILKNAARFNVNDQILLKELQQLGLQKESCFPLCRSYKKLKPSMMKKFKQETLSLPKLEDIKWRVDYVVGSSQLNKIETPSVQLELKVNGVKESFDISLNKFKVLRQELKMARALMEQS